LLVSITHFVRENAARAFLITGSLICCSAPLAAETVWSLRVLGTLGGNTSHAFSINRKGAIAGYSVRADGSQRGFLYSEGAMRDLGTLAGSGSTAFSVNSSGQVAGASFVSGDSSVHAYLFSGNAMTDLGTAGWTSSHAWTVNERGEVAGMAWTNGVGERAFYHSGGAMTILPAMGAQYVRAHGINNVGHVVGMATGYADFSTHGFVYRNGVMTDVGSLGGNHTRLYDINDNGDAVGDSATSQNQQDLPVLYRNGALMPLPPSPLYQNAIAYAINEHGDTVGEGNPATSRAILWKNGEAFDLNNLVSSSNFHLESARDINGNGQITGFGTWVDPVTHIGYRRGFMLTPGLSISASPSNLEVGQQVTVSWVAPEGRPATDWIGLFRVGTSGGAYLWYRYTQGATSGSFSLDIPGPPGTYEFRYLPENGLTEWAASQPITVRAAPGYALSASPSPVNPGQPIVVTWDAPVGHSSADWIGLYRKGESNNRNYISWQYVPAGARGTMQFDTPAAGEYEFRYLLRDGYIDVARSNTVTVNAGVYVLTATPTSVVPRSTITVQWEAPAGSPATDWIGLFKGDAQSGLIWWQYTGGASTGTATVTAPAESGQYEFRYFLNDSYRFAAFSRVFVQQPTGSYSLSASPSRILVGGKIAVNWTAPTGRPASDWIGMYRVGDPNQAYLASAQTGGSTSGTVEFTAPSTAGHYEFRYLLENGYESRATSNVVEVTAYWIVASPTTIAAGGTVTVSWNAPAGSSSADWIGLYREGELENRNYMSWFYSGGASSGSRAVTMPATLGRYVFRYLLNNGYTHVAESGVVTVQ